MSASYDVAIAGLGAMGSAAAYDAARRGARVIGFDRYAPPHTLGSSHGETRIIREAYFEDPAYVPLVQRAYDRWHELEMATDRQLLRHTGGLMIGAIDSVLVRGALASARQHDLPHEILSADDVRRRFPAFHLPEEHVAVWEPRAGVLAPEQCIDAHLQLALRFGAELHTHEPVASWEADGDGVRIVTPQGVYRAARLILATGAWLVPAAAEIGVPLIPSRQTLHWFRPAVALERFDPDRFPIYLWEHDAERWIYGFPALGGRIKVARHHGGEPATPDGLDRAVRPAEIADVRAPFAALLPGADGEWRESAVCLYTNTPDGHFLLDRHPVYPQVVLVSACSGHGFKFASAIGEVAADLALDGHTRSDIGLFRLARFGL